MTLYKLATDKESIHCWEIEVKDNTFYTTTWKLGSEKRVKSKPTVVQGKNEGKKNATTAEEQAAKEAEAKRVKKRQSGYFDTPEEARLSAATFRPMLAEEYLEQKNKLVYPVYVQPKLDGVRTLMSREKAFTRTLLPSYGGVPIHARLSKEGFFEKKKDATFDGELYNHTLKDDFNTLTSLARKEKDRDALEAEKAVELEYWVYDCYFADTPNIPFSGRLKFLQTLKKNGSFRLVPTYIANNEEEIEALYAQLLDEGYEGIMVRMDEAYECKRTDALLKYKPLHTDEFELVDITEGKGNRSGMAGRLILKTKEGKTFEANIIGGYTFYRKLWLEKDQLIGKLVTVRYQNLTPKEKVPRFGVAIAIRDYE